MTMKLSRIPKQGRVYEEFKLYHLNCEFGTIRELCQDLLEYAKYYTNIVFKRNTDTDLISAEVIVKGKDIIYNNIG